MTQQSPFAASLRVNDLEQLDSAIPHWQGRYDQISNGRYEGTFQYVSGGLIRIIAIEANQKMRVRGHETSGFVWV